MKKQRFIFRKQRELAGYNHITDFYFLNNGKPAFILGYNYNNFWSVLKMKKTLLNLRASNYLYAAICDKKELIKETVKELIEKKIADGFIISQILYDTDHSNHFEKYNFTDLIFTLKKGSDTEYYNYRFYCLNALKEAENYILPLTSGLTEKKSDREKFPNSTIIIKELIE